MNEIILFGGNDKGAISTPNPEINKKKEVISMPRDIEDNHELPQSPSKSTSETALELACKIILFEALVKENTETLIKGFNQLSALMNMPSQDHPNQLYYPKIEKKH